MHLGKYLDKKDALKLKRLLKQKAPFETGSLKSKIQTTQEVPDGFVVVVGTSGETQAKRTPSKYASILEKEGKHAGWVKRVCLEWANETKARYNIKVGEEDV